MKTEQGKTIKQIADELGLSKQQVYRYVKRNCISEAHQRSGVMYYDEAAEALIKQGFSENTASSEAHHEVLHDAVGDAVINMLQQELKHKDEQIAAQQKTIDDLTTSLMQSNAALVVAQQTAQDAQALHAGTMQKLLEDGKRKIFRFPWKKNRKEDGGYVRQ